MYFVEGIGRLTGLSGAPTVEDRDVLPPRVGVLIFGVQCLVDQRLFNGKVRIGCGLSFGPWVINSQINADMSLTEFAVYSVHCTCSTRITTEQRS